MEIPLNSLSYEPRMSVCMMVLKHKNKNKIKYWCLANVNLSMCFLSCSRALGIEVGFTVYNVVGWISAGVMQSW